MTTTFAQVTGAIPAQPEVEARAIGLPETAGRLQQQMAYWMERDGPEATAASAGAKAADKTRRYIQHLMDRGGDNAPRCPIALRLHEARLTLRDVAPGDAPQQQQQQGKPFQPFGTLTTQEQVMFASLAPLSYAEALEHMPALARFQPQEIEDLVAMLRA